MEGAGTGLGTAHVGDSALVVLGGVAEGKMQRLKREKRANLGSQPFAGDTLT